MHAIPTRHCIQKMVTTAKQQAPTASELIHNSQSGRALLLLSWQLPRESACNRSMAIDQLLWLDSKA
jgi:hypothetical protein